MVAPRTAKKFDLNEVPIPVSDNQINSYQPATGEELWRGEIGSVDSCVERAREALRDWANQSLGQRIELVRRFANEVRRQAEPFAELIARETGKPLWEARTEVEAVIGKVEISITAYAERTGQKKLNSALQGTAAVRHKPHGVMAVLGPYNFPAHLPNGHIVPALIAGNCIIFKPSEKTPAVGEFLVKCFHAAGIPENVVQLLIGGPEEGKELVAHWLVDGVLFTGSARAGVAINRKLATEPGKIVALEMGGNNAIVVTDTPKVDDAAVTIIQSAFTTAGQRCTAARRLIVTDSMYDEIVPRVKTLAERLIVGEPFADPQPFMGPVIDNQTADLLTESFVALMSRGAKPILHMKRPDEDKPFLTPGILDVTDMHERPDVELFGPLLQVVRVPDLNEAITEANMTRYGLSASLVGGSPQDFEMFWNEIRAGIINWNRPTNGASSAAPFGGVGLSGNHRPAAFYAADYCAYPVTSTEMQQPRASLGVGLKE
ncbi:MAG: succinylglutamate-semialdehyde dehydrogenase [Alphaproteobacteria bacterium]|jgi:succinylglutamic semialdehyde dehydrogenase|nr:succinylglutamate-semialdehyde dehydrogenase [Alphaproteobacteria bacterium]MBU1606912.1 succinylglutamate-semialdehyde dehydrogenase [Alphaproteobacteria bacterium]